MLIATEWPPSLDCCASAAYFFHLQGSLLMSTGQREHIGAVGIRPNQYLAKHVYLFQCNLEVKPRTEFCYVYFLNALFPL